ncbi:MAG: hypothetical protein QOD11_931 [Bradyrhizobium sp.]|nr:hypothetical protein [Bradyrhizobium sp.]
MKRWLLASIIMIGAGLPTTAVAKYCSLNPPTIQKSDATRLYVRIRCDDAASETTVNYPQSSLYVGATVFRLSKGLEEKIAPSRYPPDGDTNYLDLKAVEWSTDSGEQEISFEIPRGTIYSHVLLAVWDIKEDCDRQFMGNKNGCSLFKYTLGRVDDSELPIPIDAWPRPICDKNKLQREGFFKWVKGEGLLMTEGEMPTRFRSIFRLNDCWQLTGSDTGLGYSVHRWRVGPAPK